jgi:hypothetical protein
MSTTASQTAQALVDLSRALSDYSDKLDEYIKAHDPFSPDMLQLTKLEMHISSEATAIANMAVEVLVPGVEAALGDLSQKVAAAKQTLETINTVKLALSITAAVFSAAVSIASGNPLSAAGAVLSLADTVAGAVKAAGVVTSTA